MVNKSGFTLIELVIIIIILGILAATAIPKFIGKSGFSAHATRDQLQQLLKTVQQQAMNCDSDCRSTHKTNPYACNRVVITAARFGIPTDCGSTLPPNFSVPQLGLSNAEANNSRIRFSPYLIEFNNLGVAKFNHLGVEQDCTLGCDIRIFGAQTLTLRIESQGFIHEH